MYLFICTLFFSFVFYCFNFEFCFSVALTMSELFSSFFPNSALSTLKLNVQRKEHEIVWHFTFCVITPKQNLVLTFIEKKSITLHTYHDLVKVLNTFINTIIIYHTYEYMYSCKN